MIVTKKLLLNETNIENFWHDLFNWFEFSRRNFPWRKTNNPYSILIAEKLLQQTMVNEKVVDAYNKIMGRYPTPELLANAELRELNEIFQSIGLFFRAKHLKIMAKELVENYDGRVPRTLGELLKLTGVGQYTARAVLCFAFEEDFSVVDTNFSRFLYRFYNIKEPKPRTPTRSYKLIKMAENLLPTGRSKSFNFAILDLCALICKAKEPICQNCPISKYCLYGSARLALSSSSRSPMNRMP